jgi:ribosomal protein L37AE/L43A
MAKEKCPECGEEDQVERDEVDVGVGVIYGPWHCYACGWAEPSLVDGVDDDTLPF